MLEGQGFTPADDLDPNGRLAQFMRLVNAFERDEIEIGVDLLIEQLDRRDGDPDLEPEVIEENGDEQDGALSEDDEMDHGWAGPGCPLADPGESTHPEQSTQGRHTFGDDDDAEDDCPAARTPHRDRIRRTRCRVDKHWNRYSGEPEHTYTLRAVGTVGFGVAANMVASS